MSVQILSQIFSLPAVALTTTWKRKYIYLWSVGGTILYSQDDKLASLFNPYTCFPVTLHGKDIVTYM